MLNKVILKGNIGRDPQIKTTQSGRQIATFSLATSFSWKDRDGEWQTHVDWHRISVLREATVEWIKDILKKGDTVYVEGKLSYQPWIDRFNQKHFKPHIVIEGGQGKVEHLRSSKGSPQEEDTNFHPHGQENSFFIEGRLQESHPCLHKQDIGDGPSTHTMSTSQDNYKETTR